MKGKKTLKFERVDPTGVVLESKKLTYSISNSDMIQDRFILSVGECVYSVNKDGFIIDRLVPHEEGVVQMYLGKYAGIPVKEESPEERIIIYFECLFGDNFTVQQALSITNFNGVCKAHKLTQKQVVKIVKEHCQIKK